jgi:hypothetical protein
MTKAAPPTLQKLLAAKQRRLDRLLEKNVAGTLTPAERKALERPVAEAERLAVANARRLADFARKEAVPAGAVPVTVWVVPHQAGP